MYELGCRISAQQRARRFPWPLERFSSAALPSRSTARDDFALSSTAIGWIALLGLLNYLLGRFLNFNSIRLAGVSRAAPLLAVAPLVAVTLGVLLGGESLSPLIALGTLTIVGGVVLIVTAPEQR